MSSFNYIKSTFLKLTSRTYPYRTEDDLVEEMTRLSIFPQLEKDEWGNYFTKIGNSRTIFASHLDTAHRDQVDVNHLISKQQIVTTDGKSILGADDKAGVTILLYLIKNNIPGLYYFFIGEEVGCIGSSQASVYGQFNGHYDRIISFDRKGTNSVITHQSSTRTCSDEFAKALASQLNRFENLYYKPDDTGVYTDSAEFIDSIPECTNISVGYQLEHTYKESQDLYHLNKLAQACLGVEWEKLPTKRVAGTKEYKEYKWSSITKKSTNGPDYFGWGYNKQKYYEEEELLVAGYEKKKNQKKTRRAGKKQKDFVEWKGSSGKTFYDQDGELVEFIKPNKGIWDIYRDKFLTSDLTIGELKFIKEQYLDMSDYYDQEEFNRLIDLTQS